MDKEQETESVPAQDMLSQVKESAKKSHEDQYGPLKTEAKQQIDEAYLDACEKLGSISEEELVKLSEEAMRFNDGKVEWSLVDFKSIEPLARVLEFGAQKYARNNWKKGMDVTKMMESLLRHAFSFLSGETEDQESGITHIGHIMCNCMFIQYMMDNKPERDDRERTSSESV